MSILMALPELYSSYKKWVSSNPQFVGDVESTVKWVSYFIAGRINTSNVTSELIYSISNLIVLFNDEIIRHNQGESLEGPVAKLKLWLTTLEYCEVFIELSAKKYLGQVGKWSIVTILQIAKCLGRLMLLYHYKEVIVQSPTIPVLQRNKNSDQTLAVAEQSSNVPSISFTLKRSGRVVRKVEAAPPRTLRSWHPPAAVTLTKPNSQGITNFAETMYVMKPIIHLGSMRCFGTKSWKTWLIALGVDIASLHMYFKAQKNTPGCFTKKQRLELSRRCVTLLLYILRSPFYERHSRDRVNALLMALGKIPFASNLTEPIMQYLPNWQDIYFYMWST